jgi:hypothetical protein
MRRLSESSALRQSEPYLAVRHWPGHAITKLTMNSHHYISEATGQSRINMLDNVIADSSVLLSMICGYLINLLRRLRKARNFILKMRRDLSRDADRRV